MNISDMISRIQRVRGGKEAIGVFLVAALALGLWGTVEYARFVRVQALWRQGSSALSESDFTKALRLYQTALGVDEENPRILAALLNTVAMMQNRTGAAFSAVPATDAYIERALSQSEGNKELLEAIGYLLEAKKEYTRALSFYEKALALDEKDAKIWFHVGHAQEFLGNIEQSVAAYEKAYALDPGNPLMLLAKANEAVKLNNSEEAYEFFVKAADASDFAYLKAEALSVASAIRRGQGYLKEAKELAERALEADPGYAGAKISYGMVVAMEGDSVKAVDVIYETIQANPSAVQGYWAMGVVLRNSGYFKESIEYFNAGMARVKDDVSLVGPQAKQKAEALFLYDIAKTKDMSGGLVHTQTLQLLEKAVQLNQDLGMYLREDSEQFQFFQSLKTNNRFILLLPAGSP